MRRSGFVLAALAVGLAGCAAGTQPPASPSQDAGSSMGALRHAANLHPCPSTAASRDGSVSAAAPPNAHPGADAKPLPALTLPCLGGGPKVRLKDLRGTPTLLNIWASWCEPCQREVPYLQAAYDAAAGRLRVLGADIEDSRRSALDFAAHAGMSYPSVIDQQGAMLDYAGPKGPPVTLFVSAGGQVVHMKVGPFTSERAVRRATEHYLGVKVAPA
jgi:thiol-disulfide isomerase/thioredoxin